MTWTLRPLPLVSRHAEQWLASKAGHLLLFPRTEVG